MKDRLRGFVVFKVLGNAVPRPRHGWMQAKPRESRRTWRGPRVRRHRRDPRRDRSRPQVKVLVID